MPTGTQMSDGFSTIIEFANAPNIALWEQEITPFGVEVPGVPQTSMRNDEVETQLPAKLKMYSDGSMVVGYDALVLDDIDAQVGVNQLISITMPNAAATKWNFWGWLAEFKPNSNKPKEKPTANCVFKVSNLNNSGAEVKPFRS
jgi:hypothetical protein